MKTAIGSPVTALKLPSTYRKRTEVKGNAGFVYYELAALHSGTGGHEMVYAMWSTGDGWREINRERFEVTAKAILDL